MMNTRSLLAAAVLPQLIAAGIMPRETSSSTPTTTVGTATTSSSEEPTSTLPTVVECMMSSAANTGDTCESFAEQWGADLSLFQSLNPDVTCPGDLVGGQSYCIIGTVATVSVLPSTTTSAKTTSDLTAVPWPTQSGLSVNCGNYYFPSANDSCSSIESAFNITEAQFEEWNPATDCTTTIEGFYVCVGLINSTLIAPPTSVPANLTSVPTSLTSVPASLMTLVRRATTTSSTATASATTSGHPSPLGPGTASDCYKYHEIMTGDTCSSLAADYNTTSEQIAEWNSDLDANCTNLLNGFFYCVDAPTNTTVSDGTTPSPLLPETRTDCSSYRLVAPGDNCAKFEAMFTISAETFEEWNPSVGSECENLWAGYYVCTGLEETD